ncbi:MAG: radical SAM protein [Phycisphaerales bacterium]|jgi:predicted DNA-binding helix-hairpin-helix protein
MVGIVNKPDTEQKLSLLSADAQYDLACACSADNSERRRRGANGKWIYPVTLPNGGTSVLFKTLLSNVCTSDCAYCPLRHDQDVNRCTLSIEETVKAFWDYYRRGEVFGLFLSSGVIGSADATMERLVGVARKLRQNREFKGYIHLKIIPGCSNAAIEEAISLSNAVSLNIETPGEKHLKKLSGVKDYLRDIIEPIKLISKLTARSNRFEKVKQTTQFIVGAADETDTEIVKYMWGLYDRLKLQRIYFSAYQKGLGNERLSTEGKMTEPEEVFVREHRLYQVDFLLRKYGFTEQDMVFDKNGNLPLEVDPKQSWADSHPERFPVDANSAPKYELLRVPGLGPITVSKILKRRNQGRLRSVEDIGKVGVRLAKAEKYLRF